MKIYKTNEIKNIALLGGAKTGKTTLAEAMLFEGGVINRRGSVDEKSSVSDYKQIELERQNSISSTVLYALYDDKKINIIDTPGFDDFVGEVISALKVVDCGVVVVNTQNGVEVGTDIAMRNAEKYNTPIVFAMTPSGKIRLPIPRILFFSSSTIAHPIELVPRSSPSIFVIILIFYLR